MSDSATLMPAAPSSPASGVDEVDQAKTSSIVDKLYDELVEEVFVRLPLEDPESLLCVALVCKKWGRIVCGPSFRSQIRKFHHCRAPMLGFIATVDLGGSEDGDNDGEESNVEEGDHDDEESGIEDGDGEDDVDASVNCRFISTSTFRQVPRASILGWYAIDSNHGRVLLCPLRDRLAAFNNILCVWCPITGSRLQLPRVRRCHNWSAALVCAGDAEAAGCGTCDHLVGCHRRPFLVILVGTDKDGTFSRVYSSADGTWGEPTSAQIPPCRERLQMSTMPAARVGNALHFLFHENANILRYDVAARGFSVFERPAQFSIDFQGNAVLMSMDDGSLGFAAMHGYELHLWAREAVADGIAGWVLRKAFTLNTQGNGLPHLIAAYGVGVVFVWTAGAGLSLANLRSKQVMEVETDDRLFGVVPYITYCIPAMSGRIFGIEDDGPNAGA